VAEKTWARLGFNGVAYTDWHSFDVCWDDSVPLGPNGAPALLLAFPGASTGRSVLTGAAHGPSPVRDTNWFLDRIEPIFPGTRAAFTGAAYEDHWVEDPWVRGAYAFYKVGQYAEYGTLAALTQGRVHFAGEHTSINNQGFLDGAVESGERAAKEIVAQI
jgi:monoamine oxidase